MKIFAFGVDLMPGPDGSEVFQVQANGSESKKGDGEEVFINKRWEKTCATLEEALSYIHDLNKKLAEE